MHEIVNTLLELDESRSRTIIEKIVDEISILILEKSLFEQMRERGEDLLSEFN